MDVTLEVVVLICLLACLVSSEDYEELVERSKDADGDGFAATEHGGEDCDDTSPSTHPEALELCDAIDNDCDGQVDEEADDASIWFVDADGDGFGEPGQQIQACEGPVGFVASDDDCDDGDPDVSPDAAERCDEKDNDCDGLVDDQDESLELSSTPSWFPDADGDGYGDMNSDALRVCVAPTGLLEDHQDCDDGDRNVNPNATEICRDGVDNDCSGDAPECLLRGSFQLSSPDIVFDGFAGSMSVSDSDSDGKSELVFGVPEGDGALYLFEEVQGGERLSVLDTDWSYIGTEGATGFGLSVLAIPDLTGDGGSELLVGTRQVDEVQILGSDGLGFQEQPVALLSGYSSSQQFGDVVLPVGELGEPGSRSIVVGAPGVKGSDQGSLYFWFDIEAQDAEAGDADLVIYDRTVPRFGAASRVSSGDVNGDGYDDLVYGVTARSQGFLNFGPFVSGESIESDDSDLLLNYSSPDSQMAQATAIGDMTGDGYEDLLAGEPGFGAGSVHLFEGGTSWPTELDGYDADASIESQGEEGLGGLIRVADLDANGVMDLVITASSSDGEGYLFYGPLGARTQPAEADATFYGIKDASCFSSIELLDINNDAAADLVVHCGGQGLQTLAVLGRGM